MSFRGPQNRCLGKIRTWPLRFPRTISSSAHGGGRSQGRAELQSATGIANKAENNGTSDTAWWRKAQSTIKEDSTRRAHVMKLVAVEKPYARHHLEKGDVLAARGKVLKEFNDKPNTEGASLMLFGKPVTSEEYSLLSPKQKKICRKDTRSIWPVPTATALIDLAKAAQPSRAAETLSADRSDDSVPYKPKPKRSQKPVLIFEGQDVTWSRFIQLGASKSRRAAIEETLEPIQDRNERVQKIKDILQEAEDHVTYAQYQVTRPKYKPETGLSAVKKCLKAWRVAISELKRYQNGEEAEFTGLLHKGEPLPFAIYMGMLTLSKQHRFRVLHETWQAYRTQHSAVRVLLSIRQQMEQHLSHVSDDYLYAHEKISGAWAHIHYILRQHIRKDKLVDYNDNKYVPSLKKIKYIKRMEEENKAKGKEKKIEKKKDAPAVQLQAADSVYARDFGTGNLWLSETAEASEVHASKDFDATAT